MSYNIVKTMTDPLGKKTCVLMLDGLSSILEIKKLDEALKIAEMFNQNTDSGWIYEVKTGGKVINKK
tara:strand:- start:77 stop:277 length:201 start_codon:yes stop_codon:yes gene_type:complete